MSHLCDVADISHTAAAVLAMPLVKSTNKKVTGPKSRLPKVLHMLRSLDWFNRHRYFTRLQQIDYDNTWVYKVQDAMGPDELLCGRYSCFVWGSDVPIPLEDKPNRARESVNKNAKLMLAQTTLDRFFPRAKHNFAKPHVLVQATLARYWSAALSP